MAGSARISLILWALAATSALQACGSGFAQAARGPIAALPRQAPVAMQQQPTTERKALVHRGGGIGIGPHVRAASLLLNAVVEFFLSWRPARPAATEVAPPRVTTPLRTTTPLFIEGTLCERVVDDEDGDSFCLCQDDIASDAYECRRAYKHGRWIYYCASQPWSD